MITAQDKPQNTELKRTIINITKQIKGFKEDINKYLNKFKEDKNKLLNDA